MSAAASFGQQLKQLRRDRGLSVLALEGAAGVSRATLHRWENDSAQPRIPELQSVLRTLETSDSQRASLVALIPAPRAVRSLRMESDALKERIHQLPARGELWRAMRLRMRLKVDATAEAMGVTARSLRRWEQSERFPSPEQQRRLCDYLGATPTERDFLMSPGMLVSLETEPLTSTDQFETRLLRLAGRAWAGHQLLMDLEFIALEAACWLKVKNDPLEWEWRLASLRTIYSRWLFWQDRHEEASDQAQRAIELLGRGERGSLPNATVAFVDATLRSSRSFTHARASEFLLQGLSLAERRGEDKDFRHRLCLFEARRGRRDAAMFHLDRFRRIGGEGEDVWTHRNVEYAEGRILIALGEAGRALERLPRNDQPHPTQQVEERLVWAEALLAVGDRNAAQEKLDGAGVVARHHGLPTLAIDRLSRRL